MLNFSKFQFLLWLLLIIISPCFTVSTAQAQTAVQSQLLTSEIKITDTSAFTITGSVEYKNNSKLGYDHQTVVVSLLKDGKPTENNFQGNKINAISEPQIIEYQKVGEINLTPGQSLSTPFSFKYPATIETGEYFLVADLFDQDSSSENRATKRIPLNGNGGFLTLDSQSCSVTVGTTRYGPNEGPTINKGDQAIATCSVSNSSSKQINARLDLTYAPYSVTSTTDQLHKAELNTELITFDGGKEQKITFALPASLEPTVYEGLLQLVDGYGQQVSPNVRFRWIIPGESAKITSINSSKSYYKKDEVAKISSLVLGSADTGWRAGVFQGPFSPDAGTDLIGSKAVIKITDDKGELCGQNTTQLPSTKDKGWNDFTFDVPITKDCPNPTIEGQILSSSDKVLDEVTKQQTSTDADRKSSGSAAAIQKAQNIMIYLIPAILILLGIGIAAFIIRRRKKGPPPPTSNNQPLTSNPPFRSEVSQPPTTMTTTILLLILAGALSLAIKLEWLEVPSLSKIEEVSAQTAVVKGPINNTSADTHNVVMRPDGSRPVQSYYDVFSNARDYNYRGGDSSINVSPNCDRIDVNLQASAGSANSCANWSSGAPVSVLIDGAPVGVSNVQTPGSELFQSNIPGIQNGTGFDTLQFGTAMGQHTSSFTVNPAGAQQTGKHKFTVRVGASYMVRHDGVMTDYHTSYENLPNCDGVNGPCYVEISHDYECKAPAQCNEECANDQECTGQSGCSTCRDNGQGKMTCQPPAQCNANCNTNEDCSTNLEGCKLCRDNGSGQKTCQGPIQCNATCNTTEDCASNLQGCTTCRATPEGTKTCQGAPPQCNAACSSDRECFGGENGCNACVEGSCQKPPSCGSACTVDSTCERAVDSCTQCVSGTCRVPPACGTSCTTKADCGVARDGCSECLEGTCSDFNENMCKCDGFEAAQLEYPSSKPFSFNAFAKVEGKDIAKAKVEGIQFKLAESDKSNPNAGTIIAQSPMYTPELVSSTAEKARFKAVWNLTPPQIKANKVYRVFSEIKCKPKRITTTTKADASDPHQYQSRVAGISTANAQSIEPAAEDELQLKTLNFIKKGQTDNCRFLFFEVNEGI